MSFHSTLETATEFVSVKQPSHGSFSNVVEEYKKDRAQCLIVLIFRTTTMSLSLDLNCLLVTEGNKAFNDVGFDDIFHTIIVPESITVYHNQETCI